MCIYAHVCLYANYMCLSYGMVGTGTVERCSPPSVLYFSQETSNECFERVFHLKRDSISGINLL